MVYSGPLDGAIVTVSHPEPLPYTQRQTSEYGVVNVVHHNDLISHRVIGIAGLQVARRQLTSYYQLMLDDDPEPAIATQLLNILEAHKRRPDD